MELKNLNDLVDLLLVLRANGVRRYSAHGVALELDPVATEVLPAKAITPSQTAALQPDTCQCGHPNFDHHPDVGCNHGCHVHQCMPDPDASMGVSDGA